MSPTYHHFLSRLHFQRNFPPTSEETPSVNMPDSSDESGPDGVGLVQNDASDRESLGSESGTEAGDDNGQGFLDVEASESGNSDSDDSSSDSGSEDASILGEFRRRAPRIFFPEFRRLPIELRHRIWQYFCPDLAPSPRVFSFQVLPNPKQDSIWESATLENQIASVNAMLRVHHESREIALKAFPDTLAIREGRRIVRFNKERDVVHLNGVKRVWSHNASIPGFSENVVNLAMDGSGLDANEIRLLVAFPNLKNLFDFQFHNDRRIPHRLRWCASDQIHSYEIQQLQKDMRVGEDLHFVYCWPDVKQHLEFAQKRLSKDEVWVDIFTELLEMVEENSLYMNPDEVARLEEISYWPMTCFGWDAADRFEAFRAKHGVSDGDGPAADDSEDEDKDGSEDDSEDDSDQNEYESEGIDDGSIHEESADEDEDDLLVDTQQASDDEEGGGGVSDFGGFSPLADEDSTLFDGNGPTHPTAHWSSPEPESGDDQQPRGGRRRRRVASSDEDEESGDEEEAEDSGRSTSRRGPIVLSDEEDEAEDEAEEKPSQSTTRRGRVVLSDDDDEVEEEAEEAPRPAGRRARVLPSDDEDEDDDEGGADIANKEETREGSDSEDEDAGAKKPLSLAEKLARNRRDNPVSEDDEESEEESSESEEEAPPKAMSLAQKLMTHRRRNPVASESEDEDEGSVVGSDDDLEDEEDEDEEDDENGMFMNLADEGESGDEEGNEDEY
ncbi:hypothetical protein CORC01_07546 [Colletotrichum orchidophilum]|uniref:2EXR domain-containing protein n=1 Tax=Colletotrichum orchidophilum TaxID=1209926 RepID=A0A1G4B758_9PEZI|nr:uncharacterized protein CORC01_07546 [Colletotrichum orchidophilum]OHE97105.1 hypothetical protein CORC01_07546 [Colletotrichum orchidophilum]